MASPTQNNNIRLLRQLKGIKQTDVAKRLGITQQAYSKLESCKRLKEKKIKQILTVMGSSMEELNKIDLFLPPL